MTRNTTISVIVAAAMGLGFGPQGRVSGATVVWPGQPGTFWHHVNAVWESSPGAPASPPGIGDYTYLLSPGEIIMNTPEVVRRLYIDRAYAGYPTTASTLTVAAGGQLTIDSLCQFGVDSGGTLNIAGGKVIVSGTDRAGTWSVRLDSGAGAAITISAGTLYIGGTSQVLSLSGSSTIIHVSGGGSLELNPGATLALTAGNSKIRLSEGGMILYHGVNATASIAALATSGKLEGFLPQIPPLYIPTGTSNGVGWYCDGENTYAFADPQLTGNERTFVVSSPQAVDDTTLRKSDLTYEEDSYWTDWNFGKSQVLDVGYTTAVWNQYRAVALLRFDLRGIPCQTVSSAIVRLYKPRNVTQLTSSIPVSVYRIHNANKDWKEGSKESTFQYRGSSWKSKGSGLPWAGGESGCAAAGVDYDADPLDTKIAIREVGEWLEFEIPAALVQQWLENPLDRKSVV